MKRELPMVDDFLRLSSSRHARFEPKIIHDKKGKLRSIVVPNRDMRRFHKQLMEQLLYKLPVNWVSVYGGIPGRSPIKNALLHRYHRYFYCFDIANAYPSVTVIQIALVLLKLHEGFGSLSDVISFVQRFCCDASGRLGTGSPSSPLLFNIYCATEMDIEIRGLIRSDGTVFTRYIDDCVISSPHPLPRIFRQRVREVVNKAGFAVNHQKSQVSDLVTLPEGITITGVVVTRDHSLVPPPAFIEKLERSINTPREKRGVKETNLLRGLVGHFRSFRPFIGSHSRLWSLVHRSDSLVPRRKVPVNGTLGKRQSFERFTPQFLDELRERASVSQVIGRYLNLKKRGREKIALCPFHNEKSPSFSVTDASDKKFFHCFGCGAHGDVIGFEMRYHGFSFPEAVRFLAAEFLPFEGIKAPSKSVVERRMISEIITIKNVHTTDDDIPF